MTDNEIIKAFEVCNSGHACNEENCPFHGKCVNEDENIDTYVLDLINRQKAEIERLEAKIERLEFIAERDKRDFQCKLRERGNAVDVLYQLYDEGVKKIQQLDGKLKTARAEAIKEFADKLKAKFDEHGVDYTAYTIVDDVMKEMGGNTNAD